MSPSTGTRDTVAWSRLRRRPAVANDCPLASSTVVLERRVESPGMAKPLTLTLPISLSSLTSGATSRRILPSPRTSGRKFSRMPNSLYSTVTVLPPPTTEPCTTGMGNSPPTRKVALSPLIATRFGSASRRT